MQKNDLVRINPNSQFASQIKTNGPVGIVTGKDFTGWFTVKFKNGVDCYQELDLIKLNNLDYYRRFL